MINLNPCQMTTETFPQVFHRLLDGMLTEPRVTTTPTPAPRVWHRNGALVLQLDLPGFRREEVKLTLQERRLSLEAKVTEEAAERRHLGSRQAAWRFGNDLDLSRLEARLADGVLEIVVPKTTGDETIREISIG